jgi:hypothetical protein
VGHLALVASAVPYSQLTLSEAVGVTLDMMRLDPRPELGHPSKAATDWAEHGLGLIDCWQARQLRYQGRGLGDVETLARRIDATGRRVVDSVLAAAGLLCATMLFTADHLWMALIALMVAGGLVARILVGFYSPWQGR